MIETKIIPIGLLVPNKGQIKDVPANPRNIKKHRLEDLQRSIINHPDMLHLRELIVYPLKARYVVLGGNMRLEACKQIGYTEVPVKILPAETPADDLRAYVIKDNIGFGEDDHDMLSSEWDELELVKWGMEIETEAEIEVVSDEMPEGAPKLVVQHQEADKLRDKFIELQKEGYVCTLK